MSRIIDGKAHAAKLCAEVADAVTKLKANHRLTPGLAVVLVGDDSASQVYVRNKAKKTAEVGMNSLEFRLPDTTSQTDLLEKIRELNVDNDVHGILVQLPLPKQIDSHAVINAIDPAKDVDGFHLSNVGLLSTGSPKLVPCTPLGCMNLLREYCDELSGLNAVVVGRSNIVGKPMASLLLAADCTVTIGHSRTKNLSNLCAKADILIAAVGRPQMITGEWVKPGAIVIDVGINRIDSGEGKTLLVGDVHFDSVRKISGAITPVPGGVGPMTIACLLRNTIQAACGIKGLIFEL
jgi:methylenetetrahydrofolate dehydrogenase (NADP+)/methenyltetrahydrofolate cyclohydrolase